LSKLVLAVLILILWALSTPALFASERDAIVTGVSINASQTAPVAETVTGPEPVPEI